MQRRAPLIPLVVGVVGLVVASFLVRVAFGSVPLPIGTVWQELLAGPRSGGSDSMIVWSIRLPRAGAGVFVGAALGTVGAAFQSLFRNPLADPYVLGVSSGASAGGTLAVLLGLDAGLGRVGWAIGGSILCLLLVLALAKRGGDTRVESVILAGVVVGAMLAGVTTLNLTLAGLDSGKVLLWLLGSTTPMFGHQVALLAIVWAAGFAVCLGQARGLNAFAVSEFMAERQGVPVQKLRSTVLCTGAVVVGATVGTVGIVGFVGLAAPHVSRLLVGNDLRKSLPTAAGIGAAMTLVADTLAQGLRPGTELPLSAVTAVLGAPVLLWALKKKG